MRSSPDSTTAAMFMQRARSPRGWGLPLSEANRFGTTIVAYDSIPAVRSIDNAVLATDGDQPDFEEKLKNALEETETEGANQEEPEQHDVDVS